jgi:hypothetical protein
MVTVLFLLWWAKMGPSAAIQMLAGLLLPGMHSG